MVGVVVDIVIVVGIDIGGVVVTDDTFILQVALITATETTNTLTLPNIPLLLLLLLFCISAPYIRLRLGQGQPPDAPHQLTGVGVGEQSVVAPVVYRDERA